MWGEGGGAVTARGCRCRCRRLNTPEALFARWFHTHPPPLPPPLRSWLGLCTLTCFFLFGAGLFIAGVAANLINANGVGGSLSLTIGSGLPFQGTYAIPSCLNPNIALASGCTTCIISTMVPLAACLSPLCPNNPLLDPFPSAAGVAPCAQCLTPLPSPTFNPVTGVTSLVGRAQVPAYVVVPSAPVLFNGVPGAALSVSSGCSACVNPLYDAVNGDCGTSRTTSKCVNPALDPAAGCLQCLPPCTTCSPASCGVCPSPLYDPASNCQRCLPRYAPGGGLLYPTLASGCNSLTCPFANMLPGADPSGPTGCTTCTVNSQGVPYTPASGCTLTTCPDAVVGGISITGALLSTAPFVYGGNVLPACTVCLSSQPAKGAAPPVVYLPSSGCTSTICPIPNKLLVPPSLFAVLPAPGAPVPQPFTLQSYCTTCLPAASGGVLNAIPGAGCAAATCANPLLAGPACTACINPLQALASGCSNCSRAGFQYPACSSCFNAALDPASNCTAPRRLLALPSM